MRHEAFTTRLGGDGKWRAYCKSCEWVSGPLNHPLDGGAATVEHSRETEQAPSRLELVAALRELQQAVRTYALGLGNEPRAWERIRQAEQAAAAVLNREVAGVELSEVKR